MKVIDALLWGERELTKAGVENPRWDADLLLGDILGWRRDQLYLERGHTLPENVWEAYQTFIFRRAAREPLQYIIKKQEFMGLTFYVDERVLIPRADSEVLVEKLLELSKMNINGNIKKNMGENMMIGKQDGQQLLTRREEKVRIADLCTGSGALAVTVAYYLPEASVVGTDLSGAALEVAQYNAERNNVYVEWRQGDFLEPIRGERWDWLITNPPYIPEEEYLTLAPEIFYEPHMALVGDEQGLSFYRRLAKEGASLLTREGRILMEIGWNQGEAVQALFQKQGFRTHVFQDYGGRDRVVYAEFMTR